VQDSRITTEVTTEVRLLQAISGKISKQKLRASLGLKNDEHFRSAGQDLIDWPVLMRQLNNLP
jgi:hypothetical protein